MLLVEGSASTVEYGGRFGGRVSEFTTDEVEDALNLQQKSEMPTDIIAETIAQVHNEIQRQHGGSNEPTEMSAEVEQMCRELAKGSPGSVIRVEQTMISVETIQPENPTEQKQVTGKGAQQQKLANRNIKKVVVGAKGYKITYVLI